MGIFNFRKKGQLVPIYVRTLPGSTGTSLTSDSTSFACRDLICSTISSLSLDLYDRRSRQLVIDHPLQVLVKNPNIDETRSTFFYQSGYDYFEGNIYYRLIYSGKDLVALYRLNPANMIITRDAQYNKIYHYNGQVLTDSDILHVPARWKFDGDKGYSIYSAAAEVFALNKSLNDYTNYSFINSMGNRVVIDVSEAFGNVSDDVKEEIRTKYVAGELTALKSGTPLIITKRGIKYSVLESGLKDNRSSQLIENRTFQQSEITKLFGVPLSFILGENKYGAIEDLFNVYMQTAIKPITTVIEQSFSKLLSYEERSNLYFEFDYNSLLKTSLQSRIDSYTKQLMNGILSVNEIRARENLAPIEGTSGDVHFVPSNLMPLTEENIDAYMGSSKVKMAQEAPGLGSDKL